MSKQIVVSADAYAKLGNIAKALRARRGKTVTFAEVIDYLLSEHAS